MIKAITAQVEYYAIDTDSMWGLQGKKVFYVDSVLYLWGVVYILITAFRLFLSLFLLKQRLRVFISEVNVR